MTLKRSLRILYPWTAVLIMLSVLLIITLFVFINTFSYPTGISDLKLHSTWLFFLAEYGFNNLVPNYWNGFLPFTTYGPGWSFFSLPWYYITHDAFKAVFFSFLQMLVLCFSSIYFLGGLFHFSKIKRVTLFLFFFTNPQIIDYIKIGRHPELLSWVFFTAFFLIIFWYKDHKIDKKFLFIIPVYSVMLLTHIYPTVFASFLILSLFFIKKAREKIVILSSCLLTLLVTAFWWVPFLSVMRLKPYQYGASSELLCLGSIISYNTLFLLLFLFIFYFYYRQSREKRKDLLFFSPLIFLNLVVLTRLVVLIPKLNDFYVNVYNIGFLLIALFLFFKIKHNMYPGIIKKYLPIILVLISILYLVLLFLRVDFTPEHGERRMESLAMLPYVEGRYMYIISDPSNIAYMSAKHSKRIDSTVVAYATTKFNLSTPFGEYYHPNIIPLGLLDSYRRIFGCVWMEACDPSKLKELDCNTVLRISKEQNVKSLLSSDKGCAFLKNCVFEEKIKKTRACLYLIDKD